MPSGARAASTCPATRAGRAPIPACARRSASTRWPPTCRRTSTASTSARRRPPYERAERLAAQAFGARADVLPHQRRDAGQPRAVPGARAARHANRRPAQLARLDRRRPGAQRRAAELRGARVRRRAGHHPLRDARRARARRCADAPDARAAFIVSPTYYGMAADIAGLRAGRARRRRAAGRRPVVGSALRLQRRAAADRALPGRRRDAHEHAQDRRLADPERDAARRPAADGSTPAPSAARLRLLRSTSPSSLLLASLDGGAPPARAARRAAAARDARGDRRRAREAARRSTASRWSTRR